MNFNYFWVLFYLLFLSCNHSINVENEKKGKQTATHCLVPDKLNKIEIDDETAPQSPYIQMIDDFSEVRLFTFLNTYNNSIYYYDYETGIKLYKTTYEKEGQNGFSNISGYYILNKDSIYVYSMPMAEFALTDIEGKIKKRYSFRGDGSYDWYKFFPQFIFFTVIPIIKIQNNLILTGLQTVSLPSEKIDSLSFSACFDLLTEKITFIYTYPKELYGFNANWEGNIATFVYPELSPGGEMIHSFPMSHNIYIAPWNSNDFKTIYAGSNYASTIHSINMDSKKTPREIIIDRFMREDVYTAIRYDPYRKLYYRIILHGIPGADHRIPISKKNISVIIMDENFKYLGETVIGSSGQWNWKNMFVTCEGLNIEFINNEDFDENYMFFRIFKVEKLERKTGSNEVR